MQKGKMHPHPEALYFHIACDALNEGSGIKPPLNDEKEFRLAECGATCLVFWHIRLKRT